MKCTFDILVLGFFHRKLCCSSLQSFTRWHSAIPSDECSSAVRKKQSKIQVTIVVRYSAQWTWEYTKLDGYVLHSSWAAVCCCVSCCCCNSPSASNFLKAVELILFPVASSGTSSTTSICKVKSNDLWTFFFQRQKKQFVIANKPSVVRGLSLPSYCWQRGLPAMSPCCLKNWKQTDFK